MKATQVEEGEEKEGLWSAVFHYCDTKDRVGKPDSTQEEKLVCIKLLSSEFLC